MVEAIVVLGNGALVQRGGSRDEALGNWNFLDKRKIEIMTWFVLERDVQAWGN